MALPLFGTQSSRPTKNLVEFKAGRMNQRGKMVHPDTRKGTVFIFKSDDSLIHFCWKDRTTGQVEDDLIIFPDDADFTRVTQCTTGRVYLMKFRSSNRRFFCWMQDAKEEKDDEYCKKVNEIINGKIPVETESTTSTVTNSSTNPASTMAEMDQSQLLELLSGGGSTPVSTRSGTAGGNPVSVSALQSILSGIPANNSSSNNNPQQQSTCQVNVFNVIDKEAVDSLLASPETVAQLQKHLPEALQNDPDSLRKTLQSPQFQQALAQFSAAFSSGQLVPVVRSLGFSDSAGNAAAGGDFEAFVKAVHEATKKNDTEEMDLD